MSDRPTPARTRFAPSPTGYLHIGSLRTVLFSWLWARHTGGQFLLRIEDTDRKRFVEGAEEQLTSSLQAIGLMWDEGPIVGGPHAPYKQSERLEIYQAHAQALIDKGVAYRSYATADEIAAINAEREARGEPKLLVFRNLPGIDDAAREAAGADYNVRLSLKTTGQTVVQDLVRGQIVFDNAALKMPDPVLLKTDGFPTYALAAMVDDHLMGITHVLRADEWIPTWPIHHQIYEAFGWEQPVWVHVPQVLGSDGKKLSKRHGDTSVTEYIDLGFVPEAIINYLALIGWSYDDKTEFMTLEELIERFDLNRIRPSGGVFDRDKLLHFNGVYLRNMAPAELAQRVAPYLSKAGLISAEPTAAELAKITEYLPLVQDRLKLLSEAPELLDFFFVDPQGYDPALLVPKKGDPAQTVEILGQVKASFEAVETWDAPSLDKLLHDFVNQLGLKIPQVFMPIRVAISGRTTSPGLFETLAVLGKAVTLARISTAAAALSSASV
ncbi:MAG TPA: glutamate--tRNA ligase [Herpetosiphon sp.]|uniref:Glutamate--tRNA ligase n=1 Tax=Herpetosiphon aurantiacus (strain ATCC 23779 / DSM 785 / 114-95) TaxID=316274 RepID=SYE_HERA2|nr:glutamate--tRNA ligase [Herpetosiphon sp.]A9AXJ1.1 RecName: Full=Glutamate--tRNA ligase; AltName: Full=Glutamyl-tRNA synthetase; Short=GluRS [Herpetosiphon aurantiacus DSM 785]ABX03405.1 glutamyl-tRNA synthetase [Herpetosiphon aurantiacus DSM 785]HBW48797.1 glutamate--tRNA ligase [Herpetosiphon sp.]